MAKPDKATGNKGQQKQHEVVYPDGTRGTMTQQEWKNRDKSAGIVRVDDDAPEEGATNEPVDQETQPPA